MCARCQRQVHACSSSAHTERKTLQEFCENPRLGQTPETPNYKNVPNNYSYYSSPPAHPAAAAQF
eukprot:6487386-Amphidinium_carterae.1